MLEVLDIFFHVLHISMIIINLTFWLSLRTLRIAQITLFLTLVSWVGFGYFYGFGYCFLTDWHWQIKEQLGQTNLPDSYIKYILDLITGKDWGDELVNSATLAAIILSILGCLVQTFRKRI